MKIKLLVITLTLSLAIIANAQEAEIAWGVQSKAGSSNCSYIPLGWLNNNYYAVQIDGNDGFLMNVDSKMDLAGQTELITGGKKFEADVILMRKGKITVISSDYDGGEKTNSVRGTTFTKDGKPVGTKMQRIADIKVEKNSENTDVQYFFSSDSSKMMVFMEHNVKAGEMGKMSIIVIKTDDFTEVWSTQTTFDYDDSDIQLISAAVEKNGDVMLLALVKGDDGKKLQRYSTLAFSYTGTSGKYAEKILNLDGKFISSGRIKFINDQKILITGFYNDLTEKGKDEGIEGSFLAIADPNNLDDIDLHIKKMEPVTKMSITRTGALAKFFDNDELNAYDIRDIKMHADGSGYVIAEQRYMYQHQEGNIMQRSYYFNHLILYRFDENQEITWISTIPKVQTTTISTPVFGLGPLSFWYFSGSMVRLAYKYNSFVSTEKDGVIYVLYNDHKDNGDARSLKETKTMANKNKALATVAAVDANGKWEKTPLFRGKDLEVILETSSSFTIDGIGFTISAERGKNLQYGKLEF